VRVAAAILAGLVVTLTACGRSGPPPAIDPPAGFQALTSETVSADLATAVNDSGSVRLEVLLQIEGVQIWKATGVMQWDGDQVHADLSIVGDQFRVPVFELVLIGDRAYVSGEWLGEFDLVVPRGSWVSVSKGDPAPEGLWREVEEQVWLRTPNTMITR
jgi:predicted small lipoprotein YifL